MTARILVVDDDVALAEMISIVLRGEGYVPIQAFNGKEALDLIKTRLEDCYLDNGIQMYAVILLDYSMPEMDGPEVAVEMRKLLASSILVETQMPYIVCFTAYDTDAHK